MPKILTNTIIVDKKGGLIIPSQIRKQKGIKLGTVLTLKISGDQLIFEIQPDPIQSAKGSLKDTGLTTAQFLAERKADDLKWLNKLNLI